MSLPNWIATIGVGVLLIAFFLNIYGYIDNKSKIYVLLNAVGGMVSGYASWMIGFYPFVVLNIIWSFTSLVSLFKKSVPRETFKSE